jgi:hypothetical protein
MLIHQNYALFACQFLRNAQNAPLSLRQDLANCEQDPRKKRPFRWINVIVTTFNLGICDHETFL